MIVGMALSRFKAYKQLKSLPIKPITLLCGTNSCGKSSILQSILLAKQTIESHGFSNQGLLINGRLARLGAFEDICYAHDLSQSVELGYAIRVERSALEASHRPLTAVELLLHDHPFSIAAVPVSVDISFRFRLKSSPMAGDASLAPPEVEGLTVHARWSTPSWTAPINSEIQFKRVKRDRYKVSFTNLRDRLKDRSHSTTNGEGEFDATFTNLRPTIQVSDHENERERFNTLDRALRRFFDVLENDLGNISYIGPLREQPSRRYIYENEVLDIGPKGENAAHLFLTEAEKPINHEFDYDRVNDNFWHIPGRRMLGQSVESWMNALGMAQFRPKYNGDTIRLEMNANNAPTTRVSIADVGFGVSQTFPIILEGLRLPRGGTLALEQPEIHLHPKLQMQMADFFVTMALSGKGVIVETHSDHIVNRLVRRIVEDRDFDLASKIAIYFVTPSLEGAVCTPVEISPNQGIVNWPTDFFDQTATEQELTMMSALKRRKERR